jgi:hypothetical protein
MERCSATEICAVVYAMVVWLALHFALQQQLQG